MAKDLLESLQAYRNAALELESARKSEHQAFDTLEVMRKRHREAEAKFEVVSAELQEAAIKE